MSRPPSGTGWRRADRYTSCVFCYVAIEPGDTVRVDTDGDHLCRYCGRLMPQGRRPVRDVPTGELL